MRRILTVIAFLFAARFAGAQYCSTLITAGGYEQGIARVILNDLDNSSTPSAASNVPVALEDYTYLTAHLNQNGVYNLSVRSGTAQGAWNTAVVVWIDYNQDDSFDVAAEEAAYFTSIPPDTTFVIPITVPAGALVGATRMRLAADDPDYAPKPGPCGDRLYGEAEDYSIFICNPAMPSADTFLYAHDSMLAFTYTGSYSGNTDEIVWDFGDGSADTGLTVSHAFASTGSFQVCFIARDVCGKADSNCQTVSIQCADIPPVAAFSYTNIGATYFFTDGSANAAGRQWDFGDGHTGTKKNPVHTFADAGIYTACLTVSNFCGTDSSCIVVNLPALPNGIAPVASGRPQVYYDAAQTAFVAQWAGGAFRQIELFDLTGRLLSSATVSPSDAQAQLSAAGLAAGVYLIRLSGPAGTIAFKTQRPGN